MKVPVFYQIHKSPNEYNKDYKIAMAIEYGGFNAKRVYLNEIVLTKCINDKSKTKLKNNGAYVSLIDADLFTFEELCVVLNKKRLGFNEKYRFKIKALAFIKLFISIITK